VCPDGYDRDDSNCKTSGCGGGTTGCTSNSQCGSGQCCRNGSCTTSCGSEGPSCNDSYKVWCPAGTTRTNTVRRTTCIHQDAIYWCSYTLGTAQEYVDPNTRNRDCECTVIPGDCHRPCPSCVLQCEPDYYDCRGKLVREYYCTEPCTNAVPTAPALTAPANGYNSPSMSVTMTWGAVTWGESCSGVTREYRLYTRPVGGSWTLRHTVAGDGTRSYTHTFANPNGRTIEWQVRVRGEREWEWTVHE
jgi:hypothetical protein